jgi:hypothetical protein
MTRCYSSGVSAIFPRLVAAQLFIVSRTKKWSTNTLGSNYKTTRALREIKEWFSGILPKT